MQNINKTAKTTNRWENTFVACAAAWPISPLSTLDIYPLFWILGFGSEKADAIKSHSWFEEAGFPWDQVLTQTFPVEHIPDTSEANVECNDHEMADFLEMSKMDLRR